MRVKVDELKSLKSIGYYYSIISPFLSYFLKTCMYMDMAFQDCLHDSNMKKIIG